MALVETRRGWTRMCSTSKRLSAHSIDNVINLENAPYALGGECDGTGGDEERLDHILLQDVGDGTLTHVDTSSFLSLAVFISQFRDCSDRVESSILSQSVGNDLECLSEGLEAVGICSRDGVSMQHQFPRNFCFRSSSSGNKKPFLHQTPDNTERVMKTPVSFFEHEFVTAPHYDAACLSRAGDSGHLHRLVRTSLYLFHKFSRDQIFCCEVIQRSNRPATQGLTKVVHV